MTRQTDTVHTCVIQLRIYTVYMMHGCNGKIHDLQFVAKFHIAHATYQYRSHQSITHLSVRDDLRAVDGRTTGTHVDCYRVSVRLYFLTLLPYKGNMRKSASARARATALRSARRFTPPCALGQPFNSGDISNFPAASSMPSIDASISCTSKSPDIISKCRDSILTLSSPSAGGSRGTCGRFRSHAVAVCARTLADSVDRGRVCGAAFGRNERPSLVGTRYNAPKRPKT